MSDLAVRALTALGKGDAVTLAAIISQFAEAGWCVVQSYKSPDGKRIFHCERGPFKPKMRPSASTRQ